MVDSAAFAIHRYFHLDLFQHIDPVASGELAALDALLKRSAFNLRHQLRSEREQGLSGALHFAKISDSGFLQNACLMLILALVRQRSQRAPCHLWRALAVAGSSKAWS
jgi:hypothetical protein